MPLAFAPRGVRHIARRSIDRTRAAVSYGVQRLRGSVVLASAGVCPCCRTATRFIATDPWLRDNYLCQSCECIPRERALMWTIERFRRSWRTERVHESSPIGRGASEQLRTASSYLASQFFPGVASGETVRGMRCEDLERMSLPDNSIDLHVTQDVMEHVFDPDAVWREIARTLAPGGMHIFTTPLVEKAGPSLRAASLVDGQVVHHREPEYHGNPVSADGALVTMRWGYDICDHIARASGLHTQMVYLDALDLGIRAEYIDVLVTRKPH